eukprot:SAG11_NODE_29075_length_314_cov_7.111628_1_plen_39_part_01
MHITPQEYALFYRARLKQDFVSIRPSAYEECHDYAMIYA